jgi:hypothetical protein
MGVGGNCICKHCHGNIRTAFQDAAVNTTSLNTPEMLAVVLSETVTSPEITVFSALMMEAVSTSESSINFYQTKRHNIPELSHHHLRLRENLNLNISHCTSLCGPF